MDRGRLIGAYIRRQLASKIATGGEIYSGLGHRHGAKRLASIYYSGQPKQLQSPRQ